MLQIQTVKQQAKAPQAYSRHHPAGRLICPFEYKFQNFNPRFGENRLVVQFA
jgi:hypothetical protein